MAGVVCQHDLIIDYIELKAVACATTLSDCLSKVLLKALASHLALEAAWLALCLLTRAADLSNELSIVRLIQNSRS